MTETFIAWVSWMPPELASFLLASLPLTESRLALPLALFVFDLSPCTAFVSTFFGNLLPVPILYSFFPTCVSFASSHIQILDRWLNGWFDSLRKKHGESYSKLGALFLFILVVAPGPGTGVWTATVLAILFRVRVRFAVASIVAGLFVGSLAILAVSLGIFEGIKLL
jgi:uncharacterized membrane protein